MKKLIIILGSFLTIGAFAQGNFRFVEEEHDFGKVPEGDSVSYEFEFTNIGDQPLKISNVQPSCGCTVPKWPTEAIQPGAKGKILAKYATKGRVGAFTKYLTITSDALESSKQLKFVGEVLAADTSKQSVAQPTVAPVANPEKKEAKKDVTAPKQQNKAADKDKSSNNKGGVQKQKVAQKKK